MGTTNNTNTSIGCVVKDCSYHAQSADYCTLSKIQVVNHHTPANSKECTDCGSFEARK
jgi:hypothetical protein